MMVQCWIDGEEYSEELIHSIRISDFRAEWHNVNLGVTVCNRCYWKVKEYIIALQSKSMMETENYER